ncbi:MlaC/ttg2D family ABC transporter substrate-binding protein [Hyphomonas jannaschiana]|jgi:phospholipid transport system substrate-binding protein|uniref:Toluene tolerance family protein n=1 Tax=Hyphomonas jannaschiana VP2 TaxID=1280952 RepID=A0A059FKG3_9PROT|nr:ABC transporter substrate-binding protein [Hyphomonas jannaschiana]KCZ91087.1 toluene tolerance family protein [Hyphomonas jannaschiana VP2]
MLRTLIASVAIALAPLPALAGPEAEALIAGAAADISDPVKGEEAFTRSIDVAAVARFALGKHARRVSAEEQARFTDALSVFLADTFRENADTFREADIVVLGSKDRSETDSIVETRITPKGEDPMKVRWRVIERNGEWRVVDVEVLGLWLAIEQRAQISAILDRPRATIDDAIAALS